MRYGAYKEQFWIPWRELTESMKEKLKQQLQSKGETMELLTLEQFYNHWQGHRRLTIRTVEAFPEDKLFSYNVEPMRPFGKLMIEVLMVEGHFLHGILSGDWAWKPDFIRASSKKDLLIAFEQVSTQTQQQWSKLTSERLEADEIDAGHAKKTNRERLLYILDNEIHHRAQGYVYLRLLGIEPPAFYER
jgi:uncharacterized damage-inducible protein DinB